MPLRGGAPVTILGGQGGGNAAGSAANPLVVTSATGSPDSAASNNGSGTIASSGGTAMLQFTTSSFLEIANPSNSDIWASWGTPSVNGAGSFPINPGASFTPPQRVNGTLALLSTVPNQPFTVNRYS